jgi:hypothetical protein
MRYNSDDNEKNNLLATLMILSHNIIFVVSDKNYLIGRSQVKPADLFDQSFVKIAKHL